EIAGRFRHGTIVCGRHLFVRSLDHLVRIPYRVLRFCERSEMPSIVEWGEQLLVKGTSTREVVFFHPPSRTLVLTDLAFNVREGGLFTRIALRLNGGWDRFGPTRALRSSIHDPAAFDASIRRI